MSTAAVRPRPVVRAVRALTAMALGILTVVPSTLVAGVAHAATLVPVSGAGSTWSSNAMDQWIGDVNQYGIKINFAATGSSDGRTQFRNATVDFAVSEIPYGQVDNGSPDPAPTNRAFSYMPIVAGGTSFMYQLHINGQQVTNLRLSGLTLAKIFTDVITNWSDPAIAADNPGITLPARQIVPVVRADGSGTTAQLTAWLAKKYPDLWNAYCAKAGRVLPCGSTSNFPVLSGSGFIPEQQSSGVAGYVTQSQSEGTIGYIEASYAIQSGYPIAKVLNDAGYYVEPTADNVAVALTQAQINNDPSSPNYLTQVLDNVYDNQDPRAYPLSSYSYMIIPTGLQSPMTSDKGYTLGKFAYYFLCQGQQAMPQLGYSPLPINLVQAALTQVAKIPGVSVEDLDISKCNNPTFTSTGANLLATTAPQPQACDKLNVTMCPTHTGGSSTDTFVSPSAVTAGTTTGPPAAVTSAAPTKAPVVKPTKGTSGSGAKPSPGAKPTATAVEATKTASPAGNTSSPASPGTVVAGVTSLPAGQTTAPVGNSSPVTTSAAPPVAADNPDQVGGAAPAATQAAAAQVSSSVAAAGGGGGGGGQGAVVNVAAIRAVPVSLAQPSGWTLQETLVVIAVVIAALVTVGPPLLSRRLRKRP